VKAPLPWPPPPARPNPVRRLFHRAYIAPGVWMVADDGVVELQLPMVTDGADTMDQERRLTPQSPFDLDFDPPPILRE